MSVTCDRSVVFPGTPVSSMNKTDRHDITDILLKVALNTINLNQFLCQKTITSVYKYNYLKLPSVTLRKQFPILQVFRNN